MLFFAKLSHAPDFVGRVAKWALAALVVFIAACGGGGGGAVQQPEPKQVSYTCPDGSIKIAPTEAEAKAACSPAKILSVSPKKDTYVAGAAFTGVTFTLDGNLGNFSATLTDASGAVFPTKISGTKLIVVAPAAPLAEGQYVVTLSGFDTASKPFSESSSFGICVAPSTVNATGDGCVLHYPETVYAIWDWHYPYKIYKDSTKEKVINATSHTTGGGGVNPIADCAEGPKLPDGKKLLKCIDTADSREFVSYINPTNNKMYDFTGVVPAGATWLYVQTDGAHYPQWSRGVSASYGTYLVGNNVPGGFDMFSVWFMDLVGNVTVAVPGTFADNGNINVLFVISN